MSSHSLHLPAAAMASRTSELEDPTPTPPHASTIHYDILFRIFEVLTELKGIYVSSRVARWRSTNLDVLTKCALVCKNWSYPAQHILLRSIRFTKPAQAIKFGRLVKDSPDLAARVHSLAFEEANYRKRPVLEILSACLNVRRLFLGTISCCQGAQLAIAVRALAQLHTFHYEYFSQHHSGLNPSEFTTIISIPTLRFLSIDPHWSSRENFNIPQVHITPNPNLQRFHFSITPMPAKFLTALFASISGSLTFLSIAFQTNLDHSEIAGFDALGDLATTVRSLDWSTIDSTVPTPLETILHQLKNIQNLTISASHTNLSSSELAEVLPCSVRRLRWIDRAGQISTLKDLPGRLNSGSRLEYFELVSLISPEVDDATKASFGRIGCEVVLGDVEGFQTKYIGDDWL
ncbi:hypothetical protein P7C70_g7992, partial [Phenoliferia sp. Uapishka_3]